MYGNIDLIFLLLKSQKAPEFTTKPTDVHVKEGETARFVCSITGVPKPTVTWYFQGK